MSDQYAEVILPLSLHDSYTYRVPRSMSGLVKPGQRVVVQFGQKKLYSALVYQVFTEAPDNKTLKEIIQILDEKPVIHPLNLRLWSWMATYYCCPTGDVLRAALPSGLKMESQSVVTVVEVSWEVPLNEEEKFHFYTIGETPVTLSDLQKKAGDRFSFSTIRSLIEKKIVILEEQISARIKPKTETCARLSPSIKNSTDLEEARKSLERSPAQQKLLDILIQNTMPFDPEGTHLIPLKGLLGKSETGAAVFRELVKKGIVRRVEREISRFTTADTEQVNMNMLNPYQEKAIREIRTVFDKKQVALIHGITASGKTEIYIHLIDEVINSGRQILYLVPEIALTSQIIRRLKNVFGKKAGIYHSRMNDGERVEIWEKVLRCKEDPENGYQVILGARSSVFLPFSDLGLIIVDEEHENSYKQYDPAPRYHARDMAVILGVQHNARVLLGSATPSFESYHNAVSGKYGLVNLHQRYTGIDLPDIIIADVRQAWKKKQMHSVLTPELYGLIRNALDGGEQVILFQNRRGYSPFVECFSCGWIPKCKNCDVSLTYHKFKGMLSCHYCGHSEAMHAHCQKCGSPEIRTRGFGTEKIEDEMKSLFPDAKIDRMDLDTTRNRNAFDRIIHNLENRKTDILIGTQMVTKGLDFEHVSVAGILNADNLINFPDFRAHERAFQLISQVSGRAGRKHNRGKVVIQTTQPGHPLLKMICDQDYVQVFLSQMEERQLFKYPPFTRLIRIIIKHKNMDTVDRVSAQLAGMLRKSRTLNVLGPEFPLVSRIQLMYQKEIWLKTDKKEYPVPVRDFVLDCINRVKHLPSNSSCLIYIDVDPA